MFEPKIHTTKELGDNSYLWGSGSEGFLVDPQRDVSRFLSDAEASNIKIKYVFETHLHNDYLTGALEIREKTGAEIIVSEQANVKFPHKPLKNGDEIQIGGLKVIAFETPGHTPEHLSYLVCKDKETDPCAIFTGGSLLVESAGRTDLLGLEWTEPLTRKQFQTLQKLTRFPGPTQLLPTHGTGSFCSASSGSRNLITTIEKELKSNPALAAPDEEAFLKIHLSNLLSYPTYYQYMGEINRKGPKILGGIPKIKPLAPEQAAHEIEKGEWVIDARNRFDFANSHIPGAVNIELGTLFGSYVGWIIPFYAPFLLILPEPEEDSMIQAMTQLIRIGYESSVGYLFGGLNAWKSSGYPIKQYSLSTLDEVRELIKKKKTSQILDVRQKVEWDSGHLEGSSHIMIGELSSRVHELQGRGEIWTICAGGYRSALAASILDRAGIPVRAAVQGGVSDILAAGL